MAITRHIISENWFWGGNAWNLAGCGGNINRLCVAAANFCVGGLSQNIVFFGGNFPRYLRKLKIYVLAGKYNNDAGLRVVSAAIRFRL
jgi:hypothetical protein